VLLCGCEFHSVLKSCQLLLQLQCLVLEHQRKSRLVVELRTLL
jgi:hypothetical protein